MYGGAGHSLVQINTLEGGVTTKGRPDKDVVEKVREEEEYVSQPYDSLHAFGEMFDAHEDSG